MKERTRLGILGAGWVVEGLHLPVLRAIEGIDIAWICDPDRARVGLVASLFEIPSHHTALSGAGDVDAVLVATPVHTRRALVEEALSRGFHAFCEKPFAPGLDDHHFMVAEARRRGLRLGVALMRRWYWSTTLAQGLLGAAVFGEVVSAVAGEGSRMQRTGRGSGWYQSSAAASGGGAMRETGSHLVDQLFSVVNGRSYRIDRCRQRSFEGLELETAAGGTLVSGSGAEVAFSLCVSRLRDTWNGVAVRCQGAELRLGLHADSPVEVRKRDGSLVTRFAAPETGAPALLSAVRAEWIAFLGAVARGEELHDEETGLLATEFIDDCYRAAVSASASRAGGVR